MKYGYKNYNYWYILFRLYNVFKTHHWYNVTFKHIIYGHVKIIIFLPINMFTTSINIYTVSKMVNTYKSKGNFKNISKGSGAHRGG